MAVILEQVIVGVLVAVSVLLLLPFLLVMAGVGAAMLLWFVASAAVLGALMFWLVFPGAYGLAILLLVLVIGLPRCRTAISIPAWRFLMGAPREGIGATHDTARKPSQPHRSSP
jgi:hypothetical protein